MPPGRPTKLSPEGETLYRCSGCERFLSIEEMGSRVRNGERKPMFRCPPCRAELQRIDAETNRAKRAAARRRSRLKVRLAVDEAKSHPCTSCGETFPPAIMEFHHRDPSQKVCSPAQASTVTAALREMEKCDVLCPTCHAVADLELAR